MFRFTLWHASCPLQGICLNVGRAMLATQSIVVVLKHPKATNTGSAAPENYKPIWHEHCNAQYDKYSRRAVWTAIMYIYAE